MAHSWMYDHGIKVSISPDANDELSAEYADKRKNHDTRAFNESNATHIENIIRSEMNIPQLREIYSLMEKPILRKEILFKEDKKNNTTFFQRDLITKPKIPNSQDVIYKLDALRYILYGTKGGYNYKKTKHNIHEEYKVNKK